MDKEYMTLGEAVIELGTSYNTLRRIIIDQGLTLTENPLDKRYQLIRVVDVMKLKPFVTVKDKEQKEQVIKNENI